MDSVPTVELDSKPKATAAGSQDAAAERKLSLCMCAVCYEELHIPHHHDALLLSSTDAVRMIQGVSEFFIEDTERIKKYIARQEKMGKDQARVWFFAQIHDYIEKQSKSLKGKFNSPDDLQQAFVALKHEMHDAVVNSSPSAEEAAKGVCACVYVEV